MDKLISKQEFQLKRIEYDIEINRVQDQLILLKQDNDDQDEIKNIKESFDQLERHDEDLHQALKVLSKKSRCAPMESWIYITLLPNNIHKIHAKGMYHQRHAKAWS